MKRSLAQRWYDLSSHELPHEAGTLRPRDFDALPFGTFLIDRQGLIHDWRPAVGTSHTGRLVGRSVFADVAPCFFIRPFIDSLFELFLKDECDETFFFTFRFSGDWRQAQVNVVEKGDSLVTLTIEPVRMIRPAGSAVPRDRDADGSRMVNWSSVAVAS